MSINIKNVEVAKFMGATVSNAYGEDSHLVYYGNLSNVVVPPGNCRTHTDGTLMYHKSYDWIMPVINKLRVDTQIDLVFSYKEVGLVIDDNLILVDPNDAIAGIFELVHEAIISLNKKKNEQLAIADDSAGRG